MPLSSSIRLRPLLLIANLCAPVAMVATRFAVPWVVVAAGVAHALLIYAIVVPHCGWLGPVITRFEPCGRQVWLTIDDGPVGLESAQLADSLQRLGVPVTFFCKGSLLDQHSPQARGVIQAGHTLANHTYNHPAAHFWWLPPRILRRELDACDQALLRVGVGVRRWFRAPVGLKHALLHRELAARGMRLIGWSVRGRDGIVCDPDAVVRRVVAQVHPGAIIVLHEGHTKSSEGILRVVGELQRLGYTFVIPRDDQLI